MSDHNLQNYLECSEQWSVPFLRAQHVLGLVQAIKRGKNQQLKAFY